LDLPSGGVEIIEKPAISTENPELFTTLPQPKTVNQFVDIKEENDEFLLKKEQPTEKPVKKPVRIIAPSLKDFDSDEEDEPKDKRQKIVSKSSGLFSILPPPKIATVTTKTLIPNSVAKNAKKASNNLIPRNVKTKAQNTTSQSKNMTSDDEDDDFKVEEFDVNAWKAVCGRKPKLEPIVQVVDHSEQNIQADIVSAPDPSKPYEVQKLVGSSKIRPENIKFIDINEEEVMTDEDIIRAKALTDPEVERPSAAEGEPISAMSKRKHHITYLAQQAKANEQELKNRWASNKYSRKQTQAKYGFKIEIKI
ncbi:uncharacterized protein, partial [Atheta coriaria]|uniref:uncharacterized protein n=1 Tax=Dalotia coriaria TaxID=877792 RepID=UPI0031F37064